MEFEIKTGGLVSPYKEFIVEIPANDTYPCHYLTTTLKIIDINIPENLFVIFGNSSDETHYTAGMQFISPYVIDSVTLVNKSEETMIIRFGVGIGSIVDSRLNVSGVVSVGNTNDTAIYMKDKKHKFLSADEFEIVSEMSLDPAGASKTRIQNTGTTNLRLYTEKGSILLPFGVEELTLSEPFNVYGNGKIVFERFE